jgi:hypothetical protein
MHQVDFLYTIHPRLFIAAGSCWAPFGIDTFHFHGKDSASKNFKAQQAHPSMEAVAGSPMKLLVRSAISPLYFDPRTCPSFLPPTSVALTSREEAGAVGSNAILKPPTCTFAAVQSWPWVILWLVACGHHKCQLMQNVGQHCSCSLAGASLFC